MEKGPWDNSLVLLMWKSDKDGILAVLPSNFANGKNDL